MHSERDYNAAVLSLNSLQSNFSAVEAIRKQGPGWNQRALPEMRSWPSDFDQLNLIHVAGTKGKGSTSSFISSILAQYLPTAKSVHAERLPTSVGLYTSPHLRFVRERVQIDGQPISEQQFARYFWEVWDRLEATSPANEEHEARNVSGKPVYFHYLTLMALHCYMQEKVGTAVIECGIGGEYDTTNILEKPLTTCVTSLGIDHVAMLGDTIESIAWHKAGIFKPGVPAFTVPQPEQALAILHERAQQTGTELRVVDEHPALAHMKLGLHGDFQRINASLAIAICTSHLSRLGYIAANSTCDQAFELPEEFIKGLETVHLGGRCETRQDTALKGLTWPMVCDCHYERPGRIESPHLQPTDPRRTGACPTFARHPYISPESDRPFQHAIFCTNTTYKGAGYKADLVSMNTSKDDVDSLRVQRELAHAYDEIDPEAKVHVLGTIEEAVVRARELAGGNTAEVLVTGSLHLVGGLIEVLESEAERAQESRS
ncbi:hypothetical protein LTR12_005024 [Friedmanniomyces endolithicus]|nr:hypothetical protein LTR12_005024 [Friedmanniomyces endolithicus]